MKVGFRVDGSKDIGMGHISRCLNIAEKFKKINVSSYFISKDFQDGYLSSIKSRGFKIFAIKKNSSIAEDSKFTYKKIKKYKLSFLFVDSYYLNESWEKGIFKICKIVKINDFFKNTKAEIIINPNKIYIPSTKNTKKIYLCGKKFTILHNDFIKFRNKSINNFKNNLKLKKVLIFFGVFEKSTFILNKVLKELNFINFNNIKYTVIFGNSLIAKKFNKKKYPNLNINYVSSVKNLAKEIYYSDFFIGGAGSTIWERLCLGKKSISLLLAKNQFDKEKFRQIENFHSFLDSNTSSRNLKSFLQDSLKKNLKQNKKIFTLNDGFGVNRIVRKVLGKKKLHIKLRMIKKNDLYILYNWANSPNVRKNAINQNNITFFQHEKWFNKKQKNRHSYIFIAEDNLKTPLGQIRFDYFKSNNNFEIDVSVDETFLNFGIGSYLLQNGIKKIFRLKKYKDPKISANVLSKNINSIRLFSRNGFKKINQDNRMINFRYFK